MHSIKKYTQFYLCPINYLLQRKYFGLEQLLYWYYYHKLLYQVLVMS